MLRRILLTTAVLSVVASFSLASGCSSSSGNTGGSSSSSGGAGSSSGGGEDATGSSSGGASSGGSGSGSGSSSGGSSSSSGGGDAGGCTAATTVTGVPNYTPVNKQSACSMAQVGAWLQACGGGNQANCNAWFMTAGNATCGACIEPINDAGPPPPTGALIYDNANNAYLNIPGCVAVVDGNASCAGPLEQVVICERDACNSMACLNAPPNPDGGPNAYGDCVSAADMGACSTQLTAALNACQADIGDGGSLLGTCSTAAGVIYEICGNGM